MKIVGAGISAARAGQKAYSQVETIQKGMQQKKQAQNLEGQQPQQDDNDGAMDEAEAAMAQQTLEDTLPAILELAWAINVRDISRTLKVSLCAIAVATYDCLWADRFCLSNPFSHGINPSLACM